MAVKTSNQHHIGPFKAQTGEGSAPHMYMPAQIQLKPVKTVEIEPGSGVLPDSLGLRMGRPRHRRSAGCAVARGARPRPLPCHPDRSGRPACPRLELAHRAERRIASPKISTQQTWAPSVLEQLKRKAQGDMRGAIRRNGPEKLSKLPYLGPPRRAPARASLGSGRRST